MNDHSPVFVEPVFTTDVSEGEDLGQTILEIEATDADSGTNGQILYSLEDDFGIFEIIEGSGDLQLSSSLNREIRDRCVCSSVYSCTTRTTERLHPTYTGSDMVCVLLLSNPLHLALGKLPTCTVPFPSLQHDRFDSL